jgi:hypothetical protein
MYYFSDNKIESQGVVSRREENTIGIAPYDYHLPSLIFSCLSYSHDVFKAGLFLRSVSWYLLSTLLVPLANEVPESLVYSFMKYLTYISTIHFRLEPW